MSSHVTVFVVDDDEAALRSVVAVLEANGYFCRGFETAGEFLDAHDPAHSGCLVTDLAMPEMTGMELHCELSARGWTIPTIVVSGYADVSQAVQMMQLGAVTVLEKPYEPRELLEAVRNALDVEFQLRSRARKLAGLNRVFGLLTAAEYEVLDRLVTGESNKVIARELGVAVRTIEHRRRRIYHKLGVDSVAQLVACVAERGYLLSGLPDVQKLAAATCGAPESH